MKKTTKAAIFVTAAAALYGAAAYGVTRTLMDVAMKREAPKAFKNKGRIFFHDIGIRELFFIIYIQI